MKKGIFLLLCSLVAMAVQATKVRESEARSKAQHFIQKTSAKAKSLKQTAQMEPTCGAFYVFNMEDDGGFVIVSADDRTEAVLGYADSGSFDMKRLPSHVRAWLQGYTDQIAAVRSGRAQPLTTAQAVEHHEAITPLLTTRWDQGEPYNLQCPPGCATGCVATAMAQVMRYHRWPEGETTEIPAYETNSTLGTLEALPPTVFNWDLMTDTYNQHSTNEEQQAVAQLMRYCGQAVTMDYGESSGAQSTPVAYALRTYFGYDVSTRCVDRNGYTARTWDRLIYNELAASRPVYYSGQSTGGGHAFVCDGYDGNGFYHINWGWGGMNNGYFKLSVLNPQGGGIGSSGTEDGYAMDQQAIVGIQKATGNNDTDDTSILSLYNMWASGTELTVQLINSTGISGTFWLGVAYHRPEETTLQILYRTVELDPNYYSSVNIDVATLGLEDGTYYFYPYSKLNETDQPEHVYGDYSIYMEVTVQNSEYQFTKHPVTNLQMNNLEFVGNKVVNMPQEVRVTISNTDGDEFNGKIYLFASKNNQRGSYVNKTAMVIEKGCTEQVSLYFTPASTGTWHVWVGLSEDASKAVGPYNMTVKAAPTKPTNLTLVSHEGPSGNLNSIRVHLKNNGPEGYFRPVTCVLYSGEDNDWGEYRTLRSSGNLNLAAQQTIDLEYLFDDVTPGGRYIAAIFAYKNHTDNELIQIGNYFEFMARDPYAKTITLTAVDTTRVYGDPNPAFTYTATGDAELMGTPALSCSATAKSSVGSYPIVINRGSVENINLEFVNGTMTITKAPLTILCQSYIIRQGDPLPDFKMKAEGLKNGDGSKAFSKLPTIHCEATQGCEPGEYPITASGGEAKNYDISYVDGVLTVLPAEPVTIIANSFTREYGDENPTFTFTTEGAQLEGQPEIICEATPTSPVGTYPIVIRKGSVTNYNATFVDATLTITKAPLTLTCESYDIKQGDPLPTFGMRAEGFKNGEDSKALTKLPTIHCEATQGCEPGEYPITASGGEAKNYDISYVDGVLTVLPAEPVTIIANSFTREYGDENPTFTFTTEGAQLEGQPEIICEATPTSHVGTYPIVIRKGSVTNYNATFVNATLTITKAPMTITAKSYEMEMGSELPEMSYEAEGFKNGEDATVLTRQPIITCEVTKETAPGEYPILISGAEAVNYAISYIPGKLTVTVPAAIATLTAAGIPFDVYSLDGRLLRHQTTNLKGLPRGYYIINQSIIFVSGK